MSTIDDQNQNEARDVEEQLERIVAPLRRAVAFNPAFKSEVALSRLRETAASYEAALSLQTQWEADALEYLTPRYFELTDEVNTLLATLKQLAGMG